MLHFACRHLGKMPRDREKDGGNELELIFAAGLSHRVGSR